jgi:hypothetical protein
VPDDDHVAVPVRDSGPDVLQARPGRESLIGLGLDVQCPRQLAAGLARPEERAREHDLWRRVFCSQALAERTGLFAPLSRQGPQLVGLPRRGFSVADEVEAHGAGG